MKECINLNIPDEEIPEITKECFNILRDKFGICLRITSLPVYLRVVSSSDYSDLQDWGPQVESKLLDIQKNFMSGGNVNMIVFHQDIIKIFHLTKREIQNLVNENFEERLWGILLAVSCPSHAKFKLKNK